MSPLPLNYVFNTATISDLTRWDLILEIRDVRAIFFLNRFKQCINFIKVDSDLGHI